MCAQVLAGVLDPSELELQVVGGHLLWVWEHKLSARQEKYELQPPRHGSSPRFFYFVLSCLALVVVVVFFLFFFQQSQ